MKRTWIFLLCIFTFACGLRAQRSYEITIATQYELDSLDPHVRNSLSNFALLSHFYEPLVNTDSEMRIQPCLATRWENPDLRTWIFYLNPKVTFHDGSALNAEDVVYTFQRLVQQKNLEIGGYLPGIEEVLALDKTTVRLRTKRPSNILLNKLRFVLIVPSGSEQQTLSVHENGSGPFVLKEWTKGSRSLRMIRNESYWGKLPAMKSVTFLLGQKPEEAVQNLLSGAAQLIQFNSKKLEAQVAESGKFTISRRDSMFLKYLGYDLMHEPSPYVAAPVNPFKNPLVREAIHIGLNRDELVRKLPTNAVPASQPIPPFIFGYNPSIPAPVNNLARASQLMKDAGFPDGFQGTLHVRSMFEDAANLVADQLRALGIKLEVKSLPDTVILPALRRSEYSLFLSRMGSPTGDAGDVLDNCFHSTDPARHLGVMNYGGYSNQDVDRSIEKSAEIATINGRRNEIQNIMTMLMKDLAWIPLYMDQDTYACEKKFKWEPRNDSFILAWEIEHTR